MGRPERDSKEFKRREQSPLHETKYGVRKQHVLPIDGDETLFGCKGEDTPVNSISLMERVTGRYNLFCALQKVQRNKGSAGIDGMTVDDLPVFLSSTGCQFEVVEC